MKIIQPSFEILTEIDSDIVYELIEKFGRVCYKSENKITNKSSLEFVSMILESGHESVLEHYSVSVRIICDRAVANEIVRHRIASYSQESTRFCNYSKEKFNKEITSHAHKINPTLSLN